MSRHTLKVLGIEIGTHEGWDQVGDESEIYFKFEPNERHKDLPSGDLVFDWLKGTLAIWSDDGCRENWVMHVFSLLKPTQDELAVKPYIYETSGRDEARTLPGKAEGDS